MPLTFCRDLGLKVVALEDDQLLQDLVLTLHHCYMHTLTNTNAFKIVENQFGKSMVRQQEIIYSPARSGNAAVKDDADPQRA